MHENFDFGKNVSIVNLMRRLDPQLYRACQAEATTKCGYKDNWLEQKNRGKNPEQGPEKGYLVLTCLYRHAYVDDDQPDLKVGFRFLIVLSLSATFIMLEKFSISQRFSIFSVNRRLYARSSPSHARTGGQRSFDTVDRNRLFA